MDELQSMAVRLLSPRPQQVNIHLTWQNSWRYLPHGEPNVGLPGVALMSQQRGSPGAVAGKGKRPLDQADASSMKMLEKRSKKPGLCRLFDKLPGGCLYGYDCAFFTHHGANCGAFNNHG